MIPDWPEVPVFIIKNNLRTANIAALVTAGILKATPIPPSNAKKSGYAGTYAYSTDTTTYDLAGTTAKDTVALLTGISDDVCKKINVLYAGAAEGDAIPAAVQTGKNIQCYLNTTDNTVVKQVISK